MSHLSDTPNDGQQGDAPQEPLYGMGQFCIEPATYYDDDGPTSLRALRDLLDAANQVIEARGTPMVQLYVDALAHALDETGA